MESFETIDYVFVLIVLFSTIFGLARGFLREAFTLANVALAALFTYFFYPYSYEFFAKQVTNHSVVMAISVFGVFIVAWIIIAIANSYLIDSLGSAKGNRLDRLLGMALGMLRGALIVISIFMGITMGYKAQTEEKNMPEWMSHAGTYNFVKMQTAYFLDIMPENFRKIYYEGSSGEIVGSVVNSLTPISEDETKLLDYGLTLKNIQTLRVIITDLPFTFDRNLEFKDMAKLEKDEFKAYATDLIDDYNDYLLDGRVKPRLEKKDIDSLKKSVAAIEKQKEDDGIYKGVY